MHSKKFFKFIKCETFVPATCQEFITTEFAKDLNMYNSFFFHNFSGLGVHFSDKYIKFVFSYNVYMKIYEL